MGDPGARVAGGLDDHIDIVALGKLCPGFQKGRRGDACPRSSQPRGTLHARGRRRDRRWP
jgi:hypothetical protein